MVGRDGEAPWNQAERARRHRRESLRYSCRRARRPSPSSGEALPPAPLPLPRVCCDRYPHLLALASCQARVPPISNVPRKSQPIDVAHWRGAVRVLLRFRGSLAFSTETLITPPPTREVARNTWPKSSHPRLLPCPKDARDGAVRSKFVVLVPLLRFLPLLVLVVLAQEFERSTQVKSHS